MTEPILAIEHLNVGFKDSQRTKEVLRDVSLALSPGEVLGVVGEAGAGKSVLVRATLRLLPPNGSITSGSVLFRGQDLAALPEPQLNRLRGTHISQVLPDAKACLNPLVRIGDFMVAVLKAHRRISTSEARRVAATSLKSVGVPDPERRLRAYPHELSGGTAQRVCLAIAMLHKPAVIIADEPTQGLDVTVQRQVLDMMADLVSVNQASLLIVTRDLGIVAQYCQRAAVMHGGSIVETAPVMELFNNPQSEYTKRLLGSANVGGSLPPTGMAGATRGAAEARHE